MKDWKAVMIHRETFERLKQVVPKSFTWDSFLNHVAEQLEQNSGNQTSSE